MIRKLIISFLVAIPAFIAGAQEVEFSMTAPNVVAINEQFRLSFTSNKEGTNLKLPDLSDFDNMMGPTVSTGSSIQIINGQTTMSVSYTQFFILRAKKEGTFTIKPATINIDGEVYQSNELTIVVVKGQQQQQQQQAPSQQEPQQDRAQPAPRQLSKDDIFVRIDLDKNSAFKSEQIIATVRIFVAPHVNLSGFSDSKAPSFEGFWTQDVEVPQITLSREAHNNRIYQVGVLKKTILFPQQTGALRIEPFTITCLVREQVRSRGGFFDDFFDSYRTVPVHLTSPPVNVNVKDLPATPAGFTGAVGQMSFSGLMDKREVKTNEAVSLKLTISGSGNLRLIEAPKVELPADFAIYDPKSTDNIKVSANGVTGTKTFEYLFIPRFEGNYTIPPVKFAYFNPSRGQFTELTTEEFNLKVTKGDDSQNATVTSAFGKQDVKYIGKDIRYIKQNQYKLQDRSVLFFGTPYFWAVYACSLFIFLLVTLIYRKKLRESANVQLLKTKHANKAARRRLREASGYMKKNRREEFYEALLKAFWGYLSDKLHIPVADLNREKAAVRLSDRKVSPQVIGEFIELIDSCELARYSPVSGDVTLEEVYNKAAAMMGKLEKQIR